MTQRPNTFITNHQLEKGATLIELIITIIIISIALSGIMSVINLTIRHSADPMVQQQAIAIAESYLEEILLLPSIDPDGSNAGETRATFDNTADYNGLNDNGAKDQNGLAITGLDLYTINITVQAPASVAGVNLTRIIVDVSRSGTDSIRLSGYKAN